MTTPTSKTDELVRRAREAGAEEQRVTDLFAPGKPSPKALLLLDLADALEAAERQKGEPHCMDTGERAVQGACPVHRGDSCLLTVAGFVADLKQSNDFIQHLQKVAGALLTQARADEAAMREIATLLKGTSLQTRCPVSVMDAYTILLERLAAREEKEKPQ